MHYLYAFPVFFIPVGSILAEHQDYVGNAKELPSSVMLEVLLYKDSMNVKKFIIEVSMVRHDTQIHWWVCFVSFIVEFSLLERSWNNEASSLPTCIKLARTSSFLDGVFITKRFICWEFTVFGHIIVIKLITVMIFMLHVSDHVVERIWGINGLF